VLIRLISDDTTAFIDIIDQGRGILPADQAQIWEILIQSERTKHEQQGAGMGLPIVKQIHAGTWRECHVGKRSRQGDDGNADLPYLSARTKPT